MPAYLDAGFAITTIIPTHGSSTANQILRKLNAPVALNLLPESL
jgi:hypothetical protein